MIPIYIRTSPLNMLLHLLLYVQSGNVIILIDRNKKYLYNYGFFEVRREGMDGNKHITRKNSKDAK